MSTTGHKTSPKLTNRDEFRFIAANHETFDR